MGDSQKGEKMEEGEGGGNKKEKEKKFLENQAISFSEKSSFLGRSCRGEEFPKKEDFFLLPFWKVKKNNKKKKKKKRKKNPKIQKQSSWSAKPY